MKGTQQQNIIMSSPQKIFEEINKFIDDLFTSKYWGKLKPLIPE